MPKGDWQREPLRAFTLAIRNGRLCYAKLGSGMKRRSAIAGMIAAVLPMQVNALECLIPTIQREYWSHKAAPDTYVLALGEFLDLKQIRQPKLVDVQVAPALDYEVWVARFKGHRASRHAFDQPFETEVTLIFPDFSVIAGGSDTSGQVERMSGKGGLVWLMESSDGYRAIAGLCSDLIDTDPADVKPALRCLRGGVCPKPD